jgi:hypothetical protein
LRLVLANFAWASLKLASSFLHLLSWWDYINSGTMACLLVRLWIEFSTSKTLTLINVTWI